LSVEVKTSEWLNNSDSNNCKIDISLLDKDKAPSEESNFINNHTDAPPAPSTTITRYFCLASYTINDSIKAKMCEKAVNIEGNINYIN
jgi:hypothetical protein